MKEVLIIRVQVTNPTFQTVQVHPKYSRLLKGKTYVEPGHITIRYPVTDQVYNRLFTEMEKQYPQLQFGVGMSTIEETK